MDFGAILTSAPVLALLGYAAFVVVVQLALQPLRLQMVDLAEEMLAEGHWNKDQRDRLTLLVDHCASLSFSLVLPVAFVVSILIDIIGVHQPLTPSRKRLVADPRYQTLLRRFFISLLGANPIAAVVTIPLMAINMLVQAVRSRKGYQLAIEEPIALVAHGRHLAT